MWRGAATLLERGQSCCSTTLPDLIMPARWQSIVFFCDTVCLWSRDGSQFMLYVLYETSSLLSLKANKKVPGVKSSVLKSIWQIQTLLGSISFVLQIIVNRFTIICSINCSRKERPETEKWGWRTYEGSRYRSACKRISRLKRTCSKDLSTSLSWASWKVFKWQPPKNSKKKFRILEFFL